MNKFISSLVDTNRETQLQSAYWVRWWIDNPYLNSYDAMGVLLMGGEL